MTSSTKKKTTSKPVAKLPTNPFVYEVLELAAKQRTKAKKIEVLRTYAHDSIKSVFIWNVDESVISLLPEGDVPYEEVDEQVAYSGSLSENIQKEIGGGEAATKQDGKGKSSLRREYTKLYHFIKGGNDSLSKTRRESMFINLLQVLHPKEAEILILTKDKLLTDKYKITFDNVKEAYPDITWGGRS